MCVNLLPKRVSYWYCDLGSNLSSIKSFCSFVFEHLICLHLRLLLLSEEILWSFCTVSHTSVHEPDPEVQRRTDKVSHSVPRSCLFPVVADEWGEVPIGFPEILWAGPLRVPLRCSFGVWKSTKLITVRCDWQLLQRAGEHLVLRVSMWPAPRWKWFSMAGCFVQGRWPDLLNRGLWFSGNKCFKHLLYLLSQKQSE